MPRHLDGLQENSRLEQILHVLDVSIGPISDLRMYDISEFKRKVKALFDGKLIDGYKTDEYIGWFPLNNPLILERVEIQRSGPVMWFKAVKDEHGEFYETSNLGFLLFSRPRFAFLHDAIQQDVVRGLYFPRGSYRSETIYVARI